MMRAMQSLSIAFSVILASAGAQSTGSLAGLITDLETQQPLVGANVMLEGTDLGAAADADGRYRVANVPVGSYTVRVTMMGYKAQARANVHIVPQRGTIANVSLEPTALELEGITVTAGFFERARDAVVSARTVDVEELRSDPVGANDMMMMMQALPSVASGGDHTNEIIIRGGGPG